MPSAVPIVARGALGVVWALASLMLLIVTVDLAVSPRPDLGADALFGVCAAFAWVGSARALFRPAERVLEALAAVVLSVGASAILLFAGLLLLAHLLWVVGDHTPLDANKLAIGFAIPLVGGMVAVSLRTAVVLGWNQRLGEAWGWLESARAGLAGVAGASAIEAVAVLANGADAGWNPYRVSAAAITVMVVGWGLTAAVAGWHAAALERWTGLVAALQGFAGVWVLAFGGRLLLAGILCLAEPFQRHLDAWNVLIFLAPFVWIGGMALGGACVAAGGWWVARSIGGPRSSEPASEAEQDLAGRSLTG